VSHHKFLGAINNKNERKFVISRNKRTKRAIGGKKSTGTMMIFSTLTSVGTARPLKSRQTTTVTIQTTTTMTTTTLRTQSFSMFNAFFDIIGDKIIQPMTKITEMTTLQSTASSTTSKSTISTSSIAYQETLTSKTYQSPITSPSKIESSKPLTSQSSPEKRMVQNNIISQKKIKDLTPGKFLLFNWIPKNLLISFIDRKSSTPTFKYF